MNKHLGSSFDEFKEQYDLDLARWAELAHGLLEQLADTSICPACESCASCGSDLGALKKYAIDVLKENK